MFSIKMEDCKINGKITILVRRISEPWSVAQRNKLHQTPQGIAGSIHCWSVHGICWQEEKYRKISAALSSNMIVILSFCRPIYQPFLYLCENLPQRRHVAPQLRLSGAWMKNELCLREEAPNKVCYWSLQANCPWKGHSNVESASDRQTLSRKEMLDR